MNGRSSFCYWLTALMAVVPVGVLAETIVVSPAADGSSRRITEAIGLANPGDTIVLSAGRYRLDSPLFLNKRGLKLAGIMGQRAVLVADDDKAAVHIVAGGVQLQDLVLQGGFYGVKIEPEDERMPVRGVAIRNCTISSTAADAVKSYLADDLLIEHCQIGPTGLRQKDNAEGIDIIASVKVRIRGCTIDQAATNAIYFKGGTRDGIVERCLIRQAGHGGILLGQDTDPEYMRDRVRFEAIDCVARNNIIAGTKMAGLGTYSGQNIAFINNTLLDTASAGQASIWIVTNERNTPSEKVMLQNNIIVGGGERPAMFIKDAAGLPTSDYNLFWAPGGKVRMVREMSAAESLNRQWSFDEWREATGMDRHSSVAEPKVDPMRYRPSAGSPVVGAGMKADPAGVDFYGKTRSRWDIGAVAAEGEATVAAATMPAQ